MANAFLTVIVALVSLFSPGWGEARPPQADWAPSDWVDHYARRYALQDPFAKLTDNHGDGFEDLYGTRNFRSVLKGIVYRGGANNRWHRERRRDNRNPLPEDGLENLCREGFGAAYYLYRTNFEVAPHHIRCESPRSADQTITYVQASPSDPQQTHEVLGAIFETIKDYRHGPIYIHCWNGWHASGLLAAKVLRQFCGLSAEEAVAYWDRNTDGHNREPRYERIRQQIRDFAPYPEFALSAAEAAMICP